MANATTIAAAAKKAHAKFLRQRNNENSVGWFAVGMVSIAILFTIFHWTRILYKRYGTANASRTSKAAVSITRIARKVLVRKIPGFTSAGHGVVFAAWLVVNLSIALTNIEWKTLNGFGKRLGWVSVANMALVFFLSLRNTPLAWMTAYSYERLNVLHQVSGYSFIGCVLVHAVVYIEAWHKSDSLHDLTEKSNVMGIVAAFAMLTILATAFVLRKLQYELFHIIHIALAALILIAVGMHRPKIHTHTVTIVVVTASMWVADRLLRLMKISTSSFGNNATITPLPHGGTRVILKKSLPILAAKPGSHCFLWIPAVRSTETHPFTLVSTDPLEMVVNAYDGFTKDLHRHAIENPGVSLKASIDGPYGTVPDLSVGYTNIVFIAGGSGASFTAAVAVDTLRKLGEKRRCTIEFIWVVREEERIEWFSRQLSELCASPLVNMKIYCTAMSSQAPAPQDRDPAKAIEAGSHTLPDIGVTPSRGSSEANVDIEKHLEETYSSPLSSIQIHKGRPDVSAVILELVRNAKSTDRLGVVACGPDVMMLECRKSVAENIRVEGPSLDFHCEQFGW